ncbi:integrase, partial [Escherichia coli]|nr:integrase [Escherichia coli]
SKVEQIINELRGISNFAKESPVNYGANIERCPTLIQIRDLYLLQYSDKRKLTTLSKITKAVELILSHIKQRDSQLQDINRTVVTGWLDQLK